MKTLRAANRARAARGSDAIMEYKAAAPFEDTQMLVAALLRDVLHCCDMRGVDFDIALAHARGVHADDQKE